MSEKRSVPISNVIQPVFYKFFECTGSSCPINCCFDWGVIGWSKNEYSKLINAEMSDTLKDRVKSAFTEMTDKEINKFFNYKINYTKDGKCPMLTDNGLCIIQKELGAEYLSFVCMSYPRIGNNYEDTIIRTCYISCNHVLHMICNDENSMKLELLKTHNLKFMKIPVHNAYSNTEKSNYSALTHDLDIFNFFYELLSEKSRSIETSIVLGALAAQNLDDFIAKKQPDKIPAVLKALEQQLNDPNQIAKLENVKPNLSLKANFSGGLLKYMKNSSTYRHVFENGHSSEEKWNEGVTKWNAAYKDKPFAMRNIALNIYISNHLPFRDKTYSIFDNYCYFVSEFAVIKFLAAAMPVEYDKNVEETFEVSVAYIDRSFTHDMQDFPKIIEYMKTFGANTPAMLLGIIK